MDLDIRAAVIAAFIMAGIGGGISLWIGIRRIQAGRKLTFFRKRRDRVMTGFRYIILAVVLVAVALLLRQYGEPVIYRFHPPTATITPTPTTTETPTITLTPTITETPTITPTLSITPTPFIPPAVETLFTGIITPSPDSVFSPIRFGLALDENRQAVDPKTEFTNPVGHMYATFSYNLMTNGVQWSALWFRGTELVFFETKPWDGGTGGYGYSDWNPDPSAWLPGDYEVAIFIGYEWKISGRFTVSGNPPNVTLEPSGTVAPTATFTLTFGPTLTATSTNTPTITLTPTVTITRIPTRTPTSTHTRLPTATESPTPTRPPTRTPVAP